ncbi:MAG: hypothetical protein K8R57_08090 [Verrucomicrobia bacterium]|nr:hypothetical protein [Verrucomicrobiota bacterium]
MKILFQGDSITDAFRKPEDLNLSPSLVHRAWTARTKPASAYQGGDVSAWQSELRGKLADLIGYMKFVPEPVPLNVRTIWKREHPLGTIEKIVFTSEPGADVPAYVCLPKSAQPPYNFFICLQGHTTGMHNSIAVNFEDESVAMAVDGDQDFGIGCMARGIAALCVEQRSFGERQERLQWQHLDYLCHQAAMNAMLVGSTLLAERVYDIDRAIDYLEQRGDVAMNKVGLMGESGGGTTTLFAAALLPRVQAAMPACCFSTFAASIQATFHCVCNYVPNLLLHAEMGDIAGLIAPKPLVIVNGKCDGIFPIGPAQAEFARVQEIYQAVGSPENCRHVICDGGHRFYADDAWPVMLDMLKIPTSPKS